MTASLRPILMILGPTAGGKTRLAIDLARSLPGGGECICADSMQVYRGMDIGTAKPTVLEQGQALHHLLDIVEPDDETFSVDAWLELAERAIETIRSRGRWPVIVGGTNLYIQSFLYGMFDGPPPDEELRAALAELSEESLRERLMQADPAAAERIHRNDRKRSIRAIEVFEKTGRRLSDLQSQWSSGSMRDDVRLIGLEWPVEEINRRINARVKAMFEQGFVEEVRALHAAGKLGRQAREALGYKQIIDHLEGRLTLEEAFEQVKIRTRQYAKQQRTWLRRFRHLPGAVWLDAAAMTPKERLSAAQIAIGAAPS